MRATAIVVRHVVMADRVFTVPTIILQPLTGFYLIHLAGFPLTSRWIAGSIILYLLAGVCWLPVVWMQVRMRDMAAHAQSTNSPLPLQYWRYFQWWTALGVVAFVALGIVFYLMVAKPM